MRRPGHYDGNRVSRPVEQVYAVRFFWAVLVVASAFSVGGNSAHAFYNRDPGMHWAVAIIVATAPPLVLLASTEGVSLLLKVGQRASRLYAVAVGMTLLLAAGAFYLSFDALRDLGMHCGFAESKAFVLPLLIDLSIVQATVALFWLSRVWARQAFDDLDAELDHLLSANGAGAANGQHQASRAAANPRDIATAAAELVEARVAPKKSPDFVKAVLQRHAEGMKVGAIADALSAHHSTVRRVLAAHHERNKSAVSGPAHGSR
ncbi:DUF2637 domain-containing protein [Mycobacterium kansasii]